MPAGPSPTRALLLLGAWLSAGCATTPGSSAIVGPDGSPMAHVHCGSDQGACFRIAGELCPSGYDMQPVLRGSDGNFLVRCRAARPIVAEALPPAPAQAVCPTLVVEAAQAKSTQRWPPAAEPWPAANPWPRNENKTGAAASSAAPAPEVDLGY
jgi:hypothetical protein